MRYLVFEEYTHSGSDNRWTRTDGGDGVTRVIPEEICAPLLIACRCDIAARQSPLAPVRAEPSSASWRLMLAMVAMDRP